MMKKAHRTRALLFAVIMVLSLPILLGTGKKAFAQTGDGEVGDEGAVCTVYFFGNGGSRDDGSSKVELNLTYDQELPDCEFKRLGYTFSSWNTERDGSGTSYAVGQSVSNLTAGADGTVKLYAQWKPNEYIIHFDGNGADSGSMDDETILYDEEKKLTANSFKRKGYAFSIWTRRRNGHGESFSDGMAVQNVTPNQGEKVTLYAQWEPVVYNIEYILNEGTNDSDNPSTYTIESSSITLKDPTREGYAFAGWYDNTEFTGNKITTIPQGSTGDKTFYAKWLRNIDEPQNVTVTYDGKSHTIAGSDYQITGPDQAINVGTYTYTVKPKDGFCWSDGTTGEKTVTVTINKATLTATYLGDSITFGDTPEYKVQVTGFVNGEDAESAVGFTAPAIADADKPDTSSNVALSMTLTPSGGSAMNYDFSYASGSFNMGVKTWTISFDGNGGTPTADHLVTNDSLKIENLPTAERDGYTFLGWFTAKDGGEEVTEDTAFDADTTVYAHWKADEQPTEIQKSGDGTVTIDPSDPKTDDMVTITPDPGDGNGVKEVVVTDKDGNPVEVTDNGDGTYAYTEPAGGVSIKVTFAPVEYKIIKGDGQTWKKGTETGLTMTADGPMEKFTGLLVDGKTVPTEDYTVVSGSTVVTLKPAYAEALEVGKHTLTVQYQDGSATGEFTVAEAASGQTNSSAGTGSTVVPRTGDSSHTGLWIVLMLGAAGSALGVIGRRRATDR